MNKMQRIGACGLVVAIAALAGAVAVGKIGPGPSIPAAGATFLDGLEAPQKAQAAMAFDSPARLQWHFIPKDQRKGLQIKDMTPEQRQAAHTLLGACLSDAGYGKATQIMALEEILRELQKGRAGPLRDPERYYFTLFGTPGPTARWGLSVEGHHLSLNFVVEAGALIAHTPAFFGSNPALVADNAGVGPAKGTYTLKEEEDLAFDLLRSLAPDQRTLAVIAETAPADLRAAGTPQPPAEPPAGLPASKMNPDQVKTLRAILAVYAGNMPDAIAKKNIAEIEAASIGTVHFAWAGPDRKGIGHYYRIQGPTFLIEFCNTQPDGAGNPANHVHTVWRDMRGDFALPIHP